MPSLHGMLPSFYHLWDLACDSAPSSPQGAWGWLQDSGQYLPWAEIWQGGWGGVPRYWLVAIWEPFKVGKEAWGKAAVRS